MIVHGKGGDESAEGVLYMMKSGGPRTEPWEHHRRRYTRKKKCYYISHGRSEMTSIGLKPVEDRAMDTEPRGHTSE